MITDVQAKKRNSEKLRESPNPNVNEQVTATNPVLRKASLEITQAQAEMNKSES